MKILCNTEQDTERLGSALADLLPHGSVVALHGTLGAGKTRLVRAFARACEVPGREVTSPTFVLVQHYQGRQTIHHFDAYRLRDEDEFLELGPEEYFESDAVSFVEWADRVESCLPQDRLSIHIELTGLESREFHFEGSAPRFAAVIDALREKLDGTD